MLVYPFEDQTTSTFDAATKKIIRRFNPKIHLQEIKVNKNSNDLDWWLHNELTELIIDVLFLDDGMVLNNFPPTLEVLHLRCYCISHNMFFPVMDDEEWFDRIKSSIRIPYGCELRLGKLDDYIIVPS